MPAPTHRVRLPLAASLLLVLVIAAGCHSSSPAAVSLPDPPAHSTGQHVQQRRFARLLTYALPMLQISVVQNADNYLAAARSCAETGASRGLGSFRACAARANATTEAIDDGPQLHSPLDTWRTAETDVSEVFTALLNSHLATGTCQAALKADAAAEINPYDQLIWKIYNAAAARRFDAVATLAKLGRVRRLDQASHRADRQVFKACAA